LQLACDLLEERKNMIIGISGYAGTGKDTVADFLVRDFNFVRVALADPIKRIAKELFDFSDETLWGSSEKRNELDKRYVQWTAFVPHMLSEEILKEFPDGKVPQYLTARRVCQFLGTEVGRELYPNVW